MPAYLARITVTPLFDAAERLGMGDALGAVEVREMSAGTVEFAVPGEAPDLTTASAEASRHAAELLDGYTYEIDVSELP